MGLGYICSLKKMFGILEKIADISKINRNKISDDDRDEWDKLDLILKKQCRDLQIVRLGHDALEGRNGFLNVSTANLEEYEEHFGIRKSDKIK